jgi:hypothetical protein
MKQMLLNEIGKPRKSIKKSVRNEKINVSTEIKAVTNSTLNDLEIYVNALVLIFSNFKILESKLLFADYFLESLKNSFVKRMKTNIQVK